MSAPPIAAVVVYPLMKLSTALVLRNAAAITGVVGAIDKKPAIVSAFAPRSVPLIKCFPGSIKGFDDMRAASFKNATIEPVKVIPPEKRKR
jgi:hypothetical protein